MRAPHEVTPSEVMPNCGGRKKRLGDQNEVERRVTSDDWSADWSDDWSDWAGRARAGTLTGCAALRPAPAAREGRKLGGWKCKCNCNSGQTSRRSPAQLQTMRASQLGPPTVSKDGRNLGTWPGPTQKRQSPVSVGVGIAARRQFPSDSHTRRCWLCDRRLSPTVRAATSRDGLAAMIYRQ